MITTVCYAWREEVKQALDFYETTRNNSVVDRAIEAGSRTVEGYLHRVFYPRVGTRYFPWPDRNNSSSRVWFDHNEFANVTAVTTGGVALDPGDYYLEPVNDGPPYDRLEINLGTSSSFDAGNTPQRSIAVTGTVGYTDDWASAGTTAEALDATELGVDVDAATSVAVGVGALMRVDDEVMLVTERAWVDTGLTLAAGLQTLKSDNAITAAGLVQGETISVGTERMFVESVTGSTVTVIRAFDGTVLASHLTGVPIYAPRTLVVERGACGSTAATHLTGATVERWKRPPLLKQAALAEALDSLMQESSGYAPGRSGSLATSIEYRELGLGGIRDRAVTALGRKARHRAV